MLVPLKEFIITSTLNQLNIVFAVKMYQNKEKRWLYISSWEIKKDFMEEVGFWGSNERMNKDLISAKGNKSITDQEKQRG